ncbi:hypothetical protein GOBAR_DD16243 [Gossypium barbadense]|nr:hypothetical protein GOBAR_DD16243 [Gossypium barbadense]
MGTIHRSGVFKKTNDKARLVIATILGIVIGFFIGVSFPSVSLYKIHLPSNLRSSFDAFRANDQDFIVRSPERTADNLPKIYVPTNPRGAELLPPGIVVPESDLYLRRLWGEPSEDLKKKPKYLVTFTVGFDQRSNIDKCVKKCKEADKMVSFIAIRMVKDLCGMRKGFLHPDVVSAYEYIFIWDEDLGVEHFNAERYIELVKKHGLEISQPGLEPNNGLTWQMTKRRGDREVHKFTEEKPGWCSDPHLPPCAAFVEIMAPVFSREAWRCVWYMIQVKTRCKKEWSMFQNRLANADKAYLAQLGKE